MKDFVKDPTVRQLARSLFRALLRETTYFPDAVAAGHLHHLVVDRFRRHHPRSDDHLRNDIRFQHKRITADLSEGVKQLRHLVRANAGNLDPATKALRLAYGRAGKRKHDLLEPLLITDNPSAHTKFLHPVEDRRLFTAFGAPEYATGMVRFTISEDYTRLRLLLDSQRAEERTGRHVPAVSSSTFKMAATNGWERPTPRKLVRNKAREYLVDALAMVLPPLPEEEWMHLRAIAEGQTPITLKERRMVAQNRMEPSEPQRRETETSLPTATKGHDVPDQGVPIPACRPVEAEVDLEAKALARSAMAVENMVSRMRDVRHRPQTEQWTWRKGRRLWAGIFEQCPLFTYDAERQAWTITWGGPPLAQVPEPADAAVFDGVDHAGKRTAASSGGG